MSNLCFIGADGYVYCKCIRKGGKLICKPEGERFRFKPYGKKKPPVEEDSSADGLK